MLVTFFGQNNSLIFIISLPFGRGFPKNVIQGLRFELLSNFFCVSLYSSVTIFKQPTCDYLAYLVQHLKKEIRLRTQCCLIQCL